MGDIRHRPISSHICLLRENVGMETKYGNERYAKHQTKWFKVTFIVWQMYNNDTQAIYSSIRLFLRNIRKNSNFFFLINFPVALTVIEPSVRPNESDLRAWCGWEELRPKFLHKSADWLLLRVTQTNKILRDDGG